MSFSYWWCLGAGKTGCPETRADLQAGVAEAARWSQSSLKPNFGIVGRGPCEKIVLHPGRNDAPADWTNIADLSNHVKRSTPSEKKPFCPLKFSISFSNCQTAVYLFSILLLHTAIHSKVDYIRHDEALYPHPCSHCRCCDGCATRGRIPADGEETDTGTFVAAWYRSRMPLDLARWYCLVGISV